MTTAIGWYWSFLSPAPPIRLMQLKFPRRPRIGSVWIRSALGSSLPRANEFIWPGPDLRPSRVLRPLGDRNGLRGSRGLRYLPQRHIHALLNADCHARVQ